MKRSLTGVAITALAVSLASLGGSGGGYEIPERRSYGNRPLPPSGPIDLGGHRKRRSRGYRAKKHAKCVAWKGKRR